jgi:hypothetical protein
MLVTVILKSTVLVQFGVSKKNQGGIDALLKLDNRFTAPFGGFIEVENVIGLK